MSVLLVQVIMIVLTFQENLYVHQDHVLNVIVIPNVQVTLHLDVLVIHVDLV